MSGASTIDACTIISCNYLPFARVLARSFRQQQPEGRFFVLLVDRNEGRIDPSAEPFELLEVEDLAEIEDPRSFLFRYTILEANTGVKPFLLQHLFEQRGVECLVYLDPDILVTGSLDSLAELLGRHSVVLTPHLTDPITDACYPDELAILQAGSFNLGFLGLRNDATAQRLLRWWQGHLRDQCVVRVEQGLFVDQKWMDLTPGLFRDVHILTDPGYNVAYWNLHGRTIQRQGEGWTANGRPLAFFHFSGIRTDSLDRVSAHQNRFRLADIGEAADLYRDYAGALHEEGLRETRSWQYAYASFDNGVSIPEAARRIYLDLGAARERFGDPFATGSGSFFEWLQDPEKGAARQPPYLSRLLAHHHRSRHDLTQAYPDPARRDLARFADWMSSYGRHELSLDPVFLDCLTGVDRAVRTSPRVLKRRLRSLARKSWHSPGGQTIRRVAREALGPERTQSVRRRLKAHSPNPPATSPQQSESPARFQIPSTIERVGINLIGYLDAETGMGEGARGLARAFEAAGIPVSLHNLDVNVLARRNDRSIGAQIGAQIDAPAAEFPWDINVLFVNADQVQAVLDHLGPGPFISRYNVGVWLWELEKFPSHRWPRSFAPLHEIWTPSRFCLEAIAAESPVPVRRVPLPVPEPAAPAYDRAHFGIAEDAFVVCFVFNYLSWFERKNPLAVVEAFRKAFADDPEALLYLKTSQADFAPEAQARLESAVADLPNARVVDAYFDREEVDSLIGHCDVYLSLHRSEGLGLSIAEAMARQRPVVATDYSGPEDFLDADVGMPIRWAPRRLGDDEGPYPAGAQWADPDTDAAAAALRFLRTDPTRAAVLGQAARTRIRERLGIEVVAEVLRQRVDRIVTSTHQNELTPPR